MKTRMLTLLTLFLTLAGFVLPLNRAQANTADVKISLVAQPNTIPGKGTAKYRDRRGEREFQVEIETARRLAGSVFRVTVNDMIVGEVKIDAFGKGRLSLNSRLGNTVPVIAPGAVVKVVNADAVVVLSGSF